MNKKVLITILIILGLAIIAGGFWYYLQLYKNTKLTQNNTQENSEQNQKNENENNKELDFKKIDTSNWKEYCNKEYGFCVKYPEGWEYDLIDGVTFEDKKSCEKNKFGECKNRVTFGRSKRNNKLDFSPDGVIVDIPNISSNVFYSVNNRTDGGFYDEYSFLDKNNNYRWLIYIIYYNAPQYDEEVLILRNIINTFKLSE